MILMFFFDLQAKGISENQAIIQEPGGARLTPITTRAGRFQPTWNQNF
ncbi:unnamed protein product, partial [Ascophyllum nodosum]